MPTHLRGLLSGPLLDRCPACHATGLVTMTDVDETNFRCPNCGRCWHLGLGYVSRVNPLTCSACSSRSRCTALFERERALVVTAIQKRA